jgi:hypothetical protein
LIRRYAWNADAGGQNAEDNILAQMGGNKEDEIKKNNEESHYFQAYSLLNIIYRVIRLRC